MDSTIVQADGVGGESDSTIRNGSAGVDAVRRRRRRSRASGAETTDEIGRLLEAVLKSRGSRGATQPVLASVITWARKVREEGEALRQLALRPRRQKAQAPAERVTAWEMNRALLDAVLTGITAIDIEEDGSLLFVHREVLAERHMDLSHRLNGAAAVN